MAVKYAMCKNCGNTTEGDKIFRCPICGGYSCTNCAQYHWLTCGKCPHCEEFDMLGSACYTETEVGYIGQF